MGQLTLDRANGKDMFRVPAAPLRTWIRAIAKTQDEDIGHQNRLWRSGLKQISRRYQQRYGGPISTADRQLARILDPRTKTVSSITADRWCILIGLHPALLWPEEWERGKAAA